MGSSTVTCNAVILLLSGDSSVLTFSTINVISTLQKGSGSNWTGTIISGGINATTQTAAAVSGEVNFSFVISQEVGHYQLRFSYKDPIVVAASNAFEIYPAYLVVMTQPLNSIQYSDGMSKVAVGSMKIGMRDGNNSPIRGCNSDIRVINAVLQEQSGQTSNENNLHPSGVTSLPATADALCEPEFTLSVRRESGSLFQFKFDFSNQTEIVVTTQTFQVIPHHLFLSIQPSTGQYGSGQTKASIGSGIVVQARDGNDNVLTGADSTSAADAVTVSVLESGGSVSDSNLLGNKTLSFAFGARNFADLGLQGDAGAHFQLRFSYQYSNVTVPQKQLPILVDCSTV